MNSEIKTKEAPAAIGPYSQGIIAGEFAFVSGQQDVWNLIILKDRLNSL